MYPFSLSCSSVWQSKNPRRTITIYAAAAAATGTEDSAALESLLKNMKKTQELIKSFKNLT